MMNRLTLAFFGPYTASIDERVIERFRTNRVQALLAYLAVETGREQSPEIHRRDALTELLWPGMPTSSALQNLRQTLYELKKIIPDIAVQDSQIPFLLTNRQTIQVNPDYPMAVDTTRFSQLLAHHPDHWQEATDLYKGNFLAGFVLPDGATFELWAADRRSEFRRQVLDALTSLVDMQIERQAYRQAEQLARQQLAIDPLREKAFQQLMTTLTLNGKRAEALQQFEICKSRLDEQLAVPVSQATEALAQTIRAEKMPMFGRTQTQLGGYELKEMIGSGNFGSVYRGIQTSVGREVAVKIIRDKYANDPDFIRQFEVEAQTIARLEHPHIVPLYDFWREPGSAYLVMRWLRGGSLADQLNGGWGLEKALPLVRQVGHALSMAHERGIIHRDIKPANILLDEAGNGYLSDFGIASSNIGAVTGDSGPQTPAEMLLSATSVSPEQVTGRVLTPASDIYSFGVLLYQLLTGAHPFKAESPIHLAQLHATQVIPSLLDLRPSLPPALDAVIQQATAKRPEDRYPSAMALANAFHSAIFNTSEESESSRMSNFPLSMSDLGKLNINPYKGLQAFGESDAGLFFGRDALIGRLTEKIIQDRFLAVVGPSGSGKSSVVKAGLLPALRGEPQTKGWFITDMLPGGHPFEELETALLRVAIDEPPTLMGQLQDGPRGLIRAIKRILPNGNSATLLLVIDQFEELFTLGQDDGERHAFIDMLVTAVQEPDSPLRVAITLRADFYDRPLLIDGLSELMQAHTEAITPLTAAELSLAIQQPAAQVGVSVEPALVTTMVTDVKEQPGGLPLLQYALTELYEARAGDTLTLKSYQEIGGVLGALAKRAESIYEGLEPANQTLARQMFLRLVTLGEGVEDTRRRVLQDELRSLAPSDLDALEPILTAYGKARLLSYDRDPHTRSSTVEVAHEALLREWPRLRLWLDGSRDDVRLQRLLGQAAAEWQAAGQDGSFLLQGSRLDQFEGWIEATTISLTEEEQTFLQTSVHAQQAQATAEAERQQRELKAAQQLAETERERAEEQETAAGRLRMRAYWLTMVSGLSLLLAGAAFIFGQWADMSANVAATQRAIAEANAEAAATSEAEAVESAALAAENAQEAQVQAQLAEENADLATTREAEALEAQAETEVERDRAEEQANLAFARELAIQANIALESDPELSLILAKESLSTAHTQEGETALHLGLQKSRIRKTIITGDVHAEISPDGKYAATNPDTWQTFSLRHADTQEVIFAGDGWVWHFLDETKFLVELAPFDDPIYDFFVWDVNKQEIIVDHPNTFQFIAPGAEAAAFFAINKSGTLIALIAENGDLLIFNAKTSELLATINQHQADISAIAFSDGNAFLAITDFSNQLYLWDITSILDTKEVFLQSKFQIFENEINPAGSLLQFNRAETKLIVTQSSGVELWDLIDTSKAPLLFTGFNNAPQSIIYSNDESLVAASIAGGDIYVWDAVTGDLKHTLFGHRIDSNVIAFSNDNSQLTSIGRDGTVRIWDIRALNGNERTPLPHIPSAVDARMSPNQQTLAVGSWSGPAKIVDRATGEILQTLTPTSGGVYHAEYSPDGQFVVTVGEDDFIRKWEASSGELLLEFKGHESTVFGGWARGTMDVEYHPDGNSFATGSSDKLVKLWNAGTGELIRVFEGYPTAINQIDISPDGTLVVATGDRNDRGENSVYVWNIETGEYLYLLPGIRGLSWGMTFHPTEPILAAPGWGGTVIAWNYETGEELYHIETLAGGTLYQLSISPDGKYLATGGAASPAQIHDVRTGETLATLTDYPFGSTAFTDDNYLIGSQHQDGNVHEITVFLEDALALAEERITRDLTEQECLQYLRRADCVVETGEG